MTQMWPSGPRRTLPMPPNSPGPSPGWPTVRTNFPSASKTRTSLAWESPIQSRSSSSRVKETTLPNASASSATALPMRRLSTRRHRAPGLSSQRPCTGFETRTDPSASVSMDSSVMGGGGSSAQAAKASGARTRADVARGIRPSHVCSCRTGGASLDRGRIKATRPLPPTTRYRQHGFRGSVSLQRS